MTAHYKPTTANEIIREHAEQVVRYRRGRCGQISEDGRSVCRFLKGHAGEHGQHMNVTRPVTPAEPPLSASDAAQWLARADDDLTVVQRIADKHLRGKIKGAARDTVVTLPLNDLLTITCAAASAQQAVRVASKESA